MTHTITDHSEAFFKPGVSPTHLNTFIQSPAAFWKYSSLNPEKTRKEPTAAMIFGRLVHCMILTPEAFDKEFAIEPVKTKEDVDTVSELFAFINKNSNAQVKKSASKAELVQIVRMIAPTFMLWGDKMDAFKKTLGRKTPVSDEDYTKARSMHDAMFANEAVRQLIGNGASEEPICWYDEGSDIMKKAKLDYDRNNLVIEYKTTVCPNEEDFSKTIVNSGYHRQIAMQIEGARSIGQNPIGGVVIAQDKDIHDDIAIYTLSDNALSVGFQENAVAFANLEDRYERWIRGDKKAWRSFPEQVVEIDLPRWYKPKI